MTKVGIFPLLLLCCRVALSQDAPSTMIEFITTKPIELYLLQTKVSVETLFPAAGGDRYMYLADRSREEVQDIYQYRFLGNAPLSVRVPAGVQRFQIGAGFGSYDFDIDASNSTMQLWSIRQRKEGLEAVGVLAAIVGAVLFEITVWPAVDELFITRSAGVASVLNLSGIGSMAAGMVLFILAQPKVSLVRRE